MRLPKPPFLEKKEHREYFLLLLLRDEKASAIVVEAENGKIKIIGKHEEDFTTSLEEASADEWVTILDKTISRAEETLPADIQTEKTVFGVKENWIDDTRIKKEYLHKLKGVCDTLELSPIGFIVISEAIAHLIQEEEGAPVSAVIAEIGRHSITLSLFKGGRLIETKIHAIETSALHTVDKMLHHFTSVEVIPSRIILLSNTRDEELAQQFIAHHWSHGIPFLHVPQVSTLPHGFDAKSVVFAAATQLGFDVVGPIIDRTKNEIKTYDGEAPSAHQRNVSQDPSLASDSAMTKEGDNFGFVTDQDVDALPHTIRQTTPLGGEDDKNASAEEQYHFQEEQKAQRDSHSTHNTVSTSVALASAFFTEKVLPSLKEISKRIPLKLPDTVLPLIKGNKAFLAVPLAGILLLVLAVLYSVFVQATITLNIKAKNIDETRHITLAVDDDNSFSDNIVAAKTESTTVDGSVSTAATGKKDVGDKAKGTVTIYNSNSQKQTIPAGTVLTSSNGLGFTVDSDSTVSSASGDIFSGTKPGTAQVSITAQQIGTDSNLPSGTTFSVGGSSTLAAKNDSAFSGGSKKQVTVVAKGDIDKLSQQLVQELSDKAKNELTGKISGDEVMIPGSTDTTLSKKSTDKNVGDEASTVTLKGTLTYSAAFYNKNDLTSYASSVIKDTFEQTQKSSISSKGIQTELHNLAQKNDKHYTADLQIQAGLLPDLDTASLAKTVTGKSVAQAEDILKQQQVESVDISLKPALPILSQHLPRFSKHIHLVVSANE